MIAVTDQHVLIIMGRRISMLKKKKKKKQTPHFQHFQDVLSSYSYIFLKKVQSATSQDEEKHLNTQGYLSSNCTKKIEYLIQIITEKKKFEKSLTKIQQQLQTQTLLP